MRRSKLEICIDILDVLAFKGQLKITHVMYKANVNRMVLREQLDFLISNGLVEQRTLTRKHIVFAITKKGQSVLSTFRELDRLLPIIETERDLIASTA